MRLKGLKCRLSQVLCHSSVSWTPFQVSFSGSLPSPSQTVGIVEAFYEKAPCCPWNCQGPLWPSWRRKWQPTPTQCLENSTDRGTWRATVHGVAKSRPRLSTLTPLALPLLWELLTLPPHPWLSWMDAPPLSLRFLQKPRALEMGPAASLCQPHSAARAAPHPSVPPILAVVRAQCESVWLPGTREAG